MVTVLPRHRTLAVIHRSAWAGVRRTWSLVVSVASSVGSPRSSLAPTCVPPLRSGRRSPDMVTCLSERLVPRSLTARPSLLPAYHHSAWAGVRRTWSLVFLSGSSLAPACVPPLRLGRRSPDMVTRLSERLVPRSLTARPSLLPAYHHSAWRALGVVGWGLVAAQQAF